MSSFARRLLGPHSTYLPRCSIIRTLVWPATCGLWVAFVYQIFSGKLLFNGDSEYLTFQLITAEPVVLSFPSFFPRSRKASSRSCQDDTQRAPWSSCRWHHRLRRNSLSAPVCFHRLGQPAQKHTSHPCPSCSSRHDSSPSIIRQQCR